jgi:hypothetical protein
LRSNFVERMMRQFSATFYQIMMKLQRKFM